MATIAWYKGKSMRVSQTIDGSGTAATLDASLVDGAGETVWTSELTASGTADEYEAIVDPEDAEVIARKYYKLVVEGGFGGREWYTEDQVYVSIARGQC